MNFSTLLKQPSAFLPIAMSIAALATVLVHIGDSGVVPEADEGAAAHIFQLLVIAQVPIASFFAFKWLPLAQKQALYVIATQIGAALAAMAPVFVLKL